MSIFAQSHGDSVRPRSDIRRDAFILLLLRSLAPTQRMWKEEIALDQPARL
jgi:hypothetical protein